MVKLKDKHGQEEIVGFALIIIIVAIILLVFLAFSLKNKSSENEASYEVGSFLQSALQYTTECRDNFGEVSVKNLIFMCSNQEKCVDGKESCSVLEDTLNGISSSAWQTGNVRPVKGYELNITDNNKELFVLKEGNTTSNFKGASQDFSQNQQSVKIIFRVYF